MSRASRFLVLLILVTGAAGKTGLAFLRKAKRRGLATWAWVRRVGQQQAVRDAGATDCIKGDLQESRLLSRALEEPPRSIHLSESLTHEEPTGRSLIAAATHHRIPRFLFHSAQWSEIFQYLNQRNRHPVKGLADPGRVHRS